MEKFQELCGEIGDIDSNDFEKVRKYLSKLKAKKNKEDAPSSTPSIEDNNKAAESNDTHTAAVPLIEVDENMPLAVVFTAATSQAPASAPSAKATKTPPPATSTATAKPRKPRRASTTSSPQKNSEGVGILSGETNDNADATNTTTTTTTNNNNHHNNNPSSKTLYSSPSNPSTDGSSSPSKATPSKARGQTAGAGAAAETEKKKRSGKASTTAGSTAGTGSGSTATPQGLSAFGFFRSTVKTNVEDKRKLFSSFVQDKRIAPRMLQQWWEAPVVEAPTRQPPAVEPNPPAHETQTATATTTTTTNGAAALDPFLFGGVVKDDEESSLLHPPIVPHAPMDDHGTNSSSGTTSGTALREPGRTPTLRFSALIEASNQSSSGGAVAAAGSCGCRFHASHIPTPTYGGAFDDEVLFCGFFGIGYDPYLARPPYFGSYNHFTNENVSETDVLRLARFPVGDEPPRFSMLDYEYDSGDDWDVQDGDEAIGSSVDDDDDEEDDDGANSLSSSDLDFINDDADESDSDDELQRHMIDARERRKNRLRGKDKLIPSFSGPFVGVLPREHPLQRYDRLDCFAPLQTAATHSSSSSTGGGEPSPAATRTRGELDFFEWLLEEELLLFGGVGNANVCNPDRPLHQEEMEATMRQRLQEAALKNRREMNPDEMEALHTAIRLQSRSTIKTLLEVLRGQQLCVGVAQKEFERTVKRFYERKHGMLVRREVPWEASDERLFTKRSAATSSSAATAGAGTACSGDGSPSPGEDDNEEQEEENEEDEAGESRAQDGSPHTTTAPTTILPHPPPAGLEEGVGNEEATRTKRAAGDETLLQDTTSGKKRSRSPIEVV